MGQQQLLLLVLVMTIVVVSIGSAIYIYNDNEKQSRRELLMHDLINFGSQAQQYFRTSRQLGGGAFNFKHFYLSPIDTGNANGSYSLNISKPSGTGFVPGSNVKINQSTYAIYIIGCGKTTGDNRIDPVKAYIRVTRDSLQATILN